MGRGKGRSEAGESAPSDFLLTGLLAIAVPGWMDRLWPLSWAEKMRRRDACLAAMGITDDGDLLTGIAGLADPDVRAKKGQVANAFNRMAEGLALLALQPGGVTFMGMHWERQSHHRPLPDNQRPLSLRNLILRCPTCWWPAKWGPSPETMTPGGAATTEATSSEP